MSLLPLLCCVVTCGAEGKSIRDVYLPASVWNDELFYVKQVEGIIHYGYPLGYFGFNESRALYLSFAAWSPVLVFPWILWGLLFGWNIMSTIWCNIVLMMLAMFLFTKLADLTGKQMGLLAILFVTFTPITRYMLSGMPECICFSLLILFLGLVLNYLEKAKKWKLTMLFVMASVMTLMRPYLLLFMVFPIYLWIRQSKKWGIAGSLVVLAGTGGAYACIKHFLGAEYFTPLFDTTWVTTFFTDGIFAGMKYLVWRLVHVGMTFTAMMKEGFVSGLEAGALFGGFITVLVLLLIQIVSLWRQKQKDKNAFAEKKQNQMILYIGMAVCMAGMLAALLLMYKMTEGSKHLATFITAGIFLIAMMDTRAYKKQMAAAVIFVYLFSVKSLNPQDYALPFRTEELVAEMDELQDVLASEMVIVQKDVPNFNHDVIWVFGDVLTANGEMAVTDWQRLYALPAGYGISCCYADYIKENFASLKSRYIAAPAGSEIEAMCLGAGKRFVAASGNMVIYELRK